MRYRIWLALVMTMGIVGSIASIPGHGGERGKDAGDMPFFNGKDLEGWEGLTEYWTYKDGVLTGAAPKGLAFNTFLCSKKTYADFELKFEVKLNKTGNSGVQIRSHIHNQKTFAVTGPQCDIGEEYWGSLYGENIGGMMKAAPKELVEKVLKKNDWNDYYIKAVGKHITIKLNGETTVDGEFEKAPDTGIIAWQIHAGGPMVVSVRNITFTPITRTKRE